ncbi:MAG: MAPEG family protein [Gammaproteobacteria bacterium]
MPVEVKVLALAGLLQVVQYVLMAVPANIELGPRYTAGPRDEPKTMTGVGGRLKRALDNHFEGLILFTLAVVVVTLGGRSTAVTETCAWIYLGARVLFIPAYASGVFLIRSLIWTTGFAAVVVMLIASLV